LEPPLCVVSSLVIIRVYTILVWNAISGSSNLNNCFYHCLIFRSISHLKALFIITIVVVILLLFIIYTINLPVVRPRSCRVIYYFDTLALTRRYQSFIRVSVEDFFCKSVWINNLSPSSFNFVFQFCHV